MFFVSVNQKMHTDWQKAIDERTLHFLVTSFHFGTYLGSVTISLVTVTVAILSFILPTCKQHICLRKWNGGKDCPFI